VVRKRNLLKRYLDFSVIYKIAIGFFLGIIAGVTVGPAISIIEPLGHLFIRMLKMIAMPLIFFTLVLGSSHLNLKKFGKIGGEIILFYCLTSLIAACIGLLMALLIQPGLGLSLEGVAFTSTAPPSLIDTMLSWVPENPFKALASYWILPTIIFSLSFGLSLSYLKTSKDRHNREISTTLVSVFEACSEVIFKIVRLVLEIAPYGVFALIAVNIGGKGLGIFFHFGKLLATDYLACVTHIILVYGGLLMLFRISPIKFFNGAKDAMLTAYVTRTTAGSLPVSMKCANDNLGIKKEIYSFSLPLGATINMDGSSLHMMVVAVMAANMAGYQLTLPEILILILTVIMASVGTAALPSATLIMLVGVLSSVGLPLEIIGLIAGVDVISDMMRTLTNVTGDLACTSIVSKINGAIDTKVGVWAKE